MNVDTGEIKYQEDLTTEEQASGHWVEVPAELEKDAKKAIENKLNRKVDLRKPSRLSKFAKGKGKQLRIKATTFSRKG